MTEAESKAWDAAIRHARLIEIAEAIGWNVTRDDGDRDRVIVRHGLKEVKHFRGKHAMRKALCWIERREQK